ncbi:hypothetical protein HNQ59_003890 [Chitinivorax tropicus]|uniref:DUF1289 domain-containing protein n=1 Tax=Chitinivorax tropicus TaxID=714531 RepID=A0A840MU09_9PROT|nr:DUF1289 domain-containing protein [Chitinivorax tropicus]MBB5020569.1 hypothetical protein [Chitinivorax tropicus]
MSRPDSPCIARCSTALGDEICAGCGRTFVEVANWVAMTDAQKELVWQRLEAHWQALDRPPPWLARDI